VERVKVQNEIGGSSNIVCNSLLPKPQKLNGSSHRRDNRLGEKERLRDRLYKDNTYIVEKEAQTLFYLLGI